MASIQLQARALGDPTRHDIYMYVADSVDPVDIAELTDHFRLSHNAIRGHLTKLKEAELVVEETEERTTRGRPRLRYRPHPTATPAWNCPDYYEGLSLLLLEMLRRGASPQETGFQAGKRVRLSAEDAADPIPAILDEMRRDGFDPRARPREDGAEIVLGNCPYESAVLADPTTVCSMHLGIAEGLAEAVGGVEVTELVTRDPRRAGCRLVLRATTPPGPVGRPETTG